MNLSPRHAERRSPAFWRPESKHPYRNESLRFDIIFKSPPEWRYRLGVRTEGSQPSNPGSIPGSATIFFPPQCPRNELCEHHLLRRAIRPDRSTREKKIFLLRRGLARGGYAFFSLPPRSAGACARIMVIDDQENPEDEDQPEERLTARPRQVGGGKARQKDCQAPAPPRVITTFPHRRLIAVCPRRAPTQNRAK